MPIYPEHEDTLLAANLKKGQIPFYIMDQTISGSHPLHHHDFAELSYIRGGSGSETINSNTFELRPGTVRLLLPQQMHAIKADPGSPLRLYCCMFDFNVLLESPIDSELSRFLLQARDRLSSVCLLRGIAAEEMQAICASVMEEYSGMSIGKNSAIHAKLIQGLLLYARTLPLSQSESKTEVRRRDWEIIQYLNSNFLHRISLKDLSIRFGLSEASISLIFQKHLGKSFLEHLHSLRLIRASSLLLNTDMSVFEISEEAGFETFRTFSRLFKKKIGSTPSEYRRLNNRK